MNRFSASDAALQGVYVLRDHWRIALGWALFNLLAIAAVVIGFVVIGVVGVTLTGGDSASVGATVGGPIFSIATVVIFLMTVNAVYRLILRPEERGFLYLRLGPDEARGFAALLALAVGVVGLALLAVPVGRAVLSVAAPATVLVALAALVAACGLTMRFGLVLPMCVAEGRIDFARSWRLTRGQGWALTGMTLLAVCLALLLSVVVWGAFFLLTLSIVGFRELGALAGPEGFRDHTGLFLLQAVAPMVLSPFVIAMIFAPWADAYQALAAEPVEAP